MSNDRTGARTMSSREPCPFCQQPLTVLGGHNNPYAKCETEGCWLADRAIAVVLDAPRQVEAWNDRAPIPVTDEMVERGVVEIIDAQRALGADPLSWDEASQKDKADAMAVMRAALTAALGGGNG